NTSASPDVQKRVYGHRCNRPPAVPGDGRRVRDGIESTDQSVTSATLGDGGIYSSVSDLYRWVTHLASLVPPSQPPSVLSTPSSTSLLLGVSQATLSKYFLSPFLLTDGTPSPYSFGFFVDRDAAGNLRLTHHGESTGFTNAILFYPHLRYAIVV